MGQALRGSTRHKQYLPNNRYYKILHHKPINKASRFYNRKFVGTVNIAQCMPDGFMGINFTRRLAGDQPLIDACITY